MVAEIEGDCPVYSVRDSFTIRDGYILETGGTRVCMHGLSSVMPFYAALSRGIDPRDLGLYGGKEATACVQCPDPCGMTGGGTVTFEIRVGEGDDA